MRTRIKIQVCILFSLITVLSCDTEQKLLTIFEEVIPEIDINENLTFVVIPDVGCNGCIYRAELFLEKHKNSDNIYFIYSGITSLKDLKFSLGDKLNANNVIIDELNLIALNEGVFNYPMIYHYEKETLKFQKEINPTNVTGFEDFEEEFLN